MRPVLLAILDGWGHSEFPAEADPGNAIEVADAPTYRRLYDEVPRTRLACSGEDVGLPAGQMGNSEVGHLNLGAGRVVYQDIARVDRAIATGTFGQQLGLSEILDHLRSRDSILHIVGLVSDGGVHSHIRHFQALLDILPEDVGVHLHCITDGRDTSPTGAPDYLRALDDACSRSERWRIATVCGRYWTMDRDRRWERTRRGFDLIVRGAADHWVEREGDLDFLTESYEAGTTDEFLEPTGFRGVAEHGVKKDDVLLMMNFRADRMRQLATALTDEDFDGFERGGALPSRVVTMTEYDDDLTVQVAFAPEHVRSGLSEHLAACGKRQLKVAETEKYAHVTYFFNGGEESPWEGEERTLLPSPKVATYDLQPEMSAPAVRDAVIRGLDEGFDFILVNFANPDMVGHTGVIPAAVQAVEAVDRCLGEILDAVDERPEWVVLVTADHGNCEKMIADDGTPHTAHTTEPVDFMVYDPREAHIEGGSRERVSDGVTDARLADVAPTVLGYMGLSRPDAMTGRDLGPRLAAREVTPSGGSD